MSQPRIGRVLIASLHQAIADILPDRLEFYENWLSPEGLREGTIGLAPLLAVLSFLRGEGAAYGEVTTRAGTYAAEWTVNALPGMERRLIGLLPSAIRQRAALRTARELVRTTYPGSRAVIQIRRDTATVDLRGSLFCEVRTVSPHPLCGFYAAAISRVLQLSSIAAEVQITDCRSAGTQRDCAMRVAVTSGGPATPAGGHA
jgi:hypothetical protein